MCLPSSCMLTCSGVLGASSLRIMRKISPNSELSAVPITIPFPLPERTRDPMKAMLDFSWTLRVPVAAFAGGKGEEILRAGSVSPVKLDSSIVRSFVYDNKIKRSWPTNQQRTNKPINQTNNQPINQSINQPINQSSKQAISGTNNRLNPIIFQEWVVVIKSPGNLKRHKKTTKEKKKYLE